MNATTSKQRRPNRKWPKLNQLLFDFGVLEAEQEEDVEYVRNKIMELDQHFDLGLFAIVAYAIPTNIFQLCSPCDIKSSIILVLFDCKFLPSRYIKTENVIIY